MIGRFLVRSLVLFLMSSYGIFSFIIKDCIDEDGDAISGCNCALTNPGIFCPANFYCPEYSELDVQMFQTELNEASCNVTGTNFVVCPCTPGFFCPENTSQPVYCCEGYYCPANEDKIAVVNEDGLGAWGERIKICPEGSYCMTGQVDPFDCNALSTCPEGSTKANRGGTIAVLIVVVLLIYVLFLFRYAIQKRKRSIQDKILLKEIQDTAVTGDSETSSLQSKLHVSLGVASNDFDGASSVDKTTLDESLTAAVKHQPFHIQFENLGLKLKTGVRVMEGVYGEFQPGRMCAVMGSSGAGKTTVINLITGKVPMTEGRVLVNGEPLSGLQKFQKLVGFVPQEDIMLRELTVRDNIQFSARYRLPSNLSKDQIERKVDACIKELGIPHVQHSVIGDERVRGVSGGQRKRVNIAIELVADPMVLFLDEPTSGLDSTTATSLCNTLRKISRERNMTTISVIHQPSLTSFLEFDDLLLLGKGGRVIYHGPLTEAPAYFESIGFPLPANCNPADFYLDVAAGIVPSKTDPNFEWPQLFDFWENTRQLSLGGTQTRIFDRNVTFSEASKTEQANAKLELHELETAGLTEWYHTIWHLTQQLYYEAEDYLVTFLKDSKETLLNFGKPDPVRETPGSLKQFQLCLLRSYKQVFRRFSFFILEMILHLGAGLVISVAAERLDYVGPYPDVICAVAVEGFQDDCRLPQKDQYTQAANFMCFGVLFSAVASASGTFGNEQVNYYREASSGLRSTPYFFGKWIADFPRVFCSAVFFYLAFSSRFQDTNTNATRMFILILVFYWFSFSMGYLVSQLVTMKNAALTGVLVALIFAVGLSGLNPTMQDVRDKPRSQQWLWTVSGPRWTIEGFYISQVEYYEEVPDGPFEGAPYINIDPGLNTNGYRIDNFQKCTRALIFLGIGWGLLALILMILSGRDKKR